MKFKINEKFNLIETKLDNNNKILNNNPIINEKILKNKINEKSEININDFSISENNKINVIQEKIDIFTKGVMQT